MDLSEPTPLSCPGVSSTVLANRSTSASLGQVARQFWWPVYGELRDGGESPESAANGVEVVLARLATGSPFLRHEENMGRLRVVLRAELEAVRSRASAPGSPPAPQQPSLATALIHWAEDRGPYGLEPHPAEVFRRRWALVVLELAWKVVGDRQQQQGDAERWKELSPYLAEPVPDWHTTDIDASVDSAAVENLRDEFREEVRRIVAETVTTPMDLEAELLDLFG